MAISSFGQVSLRVDCKYCLLILIAVERRFPIEKAFDLPMPSSIVRLDSAEVDSKDASFALASLPLELIETILTYLDVPSILSLASSCRRLQSSIMPLNDLVFRGCIANHYSWMLPMTPRERRVWDLKLDQKKAKSGGESEGVSRERYPLRFQHLTSCAVKISLGGLLSSLP